MNIQILLEQTKTKLENQLKNIDVFEIMLLEVLDYADWIVTEFKKICREEAEKKARGDQDAFNIFFNHCLYKTKDEIRENMVKHIFAVQQAGELLFEIFYNYDFPAEKEKEFLMKANEIVKQALNEYYPYEIPLST
jgi:hypothetical protein